MVGLGGAPGVSEVAAHEEVAAGDREGLDTIVERPVALAVRAQFRPGAAVPPGDVVGLGDARGVGEAAAHVEVAAGDRQREDTLVERPVAGAVRAQGRPGVAVPLGDVVGPGDARGIGEATAHVRGRCRRQRGRRPSRGAPLRRDVRAQRGPGPDRGRGGNTGRGCEAGRLAGGQIAPPGSSSWCRPCLRHPERRGTCHRLPAQAQESAGRCTGAATGGRESRAAMGKGLATRTATTTLSTSVPAERVRVHRLMASFPLRVYARLPMSLTASFRGAVADRGDGHQARDLRAHRGRRLDGDPGRDEVRRARRERRCPIGARDDRGGDVRGAAEVLHAVAARSGPGGLEP